MHTSTGPTAVFVHGAGGGGWEWAIWQRVFAAHGWDAVAPDLLPAAAGLAATRLDAYAGQVRAWCAGRAAPLVVIGASLGGLLALAAAARSAPAALVLVNPLPPAGVEPRPARVDFPAVVPWGSKRSLAATRRALPDGDDATCLFAFRRWRDESGSVLRAAHAGVAIEAPQCPVLVMAGERDGDVPPAMSRAVADWADADFQLLAGTSHVGPLLGRCAAAAAADALRWCASRPSSLAGSAAPV